jgi:predicted nuclease with RNAse H fold
VRALGIDVGVHKGLDVVLLEDGGGGWKAREPVETASRVAVDQVTELIQQWKPDVVAVDAPPAWGSGGGSRRTERELRRFGIQSFGTPAGSHESEEHPFYAWMRVGFAVFGAAREAGFPRYRSGRVGGTAIEVFPHASAVVLAGCLPPPSARKRRWRARVLVAQRVQADGLHSADQVDAALAALTGLLAAQGRCTALGDPREGVIVLPVSSLPAHAYRRCRDDERAEDLQPRFPGMTPCACGDPACTDTTAREFAPGHDAKRKSILWARTRTGRDAVEELRRRQWELPPEMR